VAVENSHVLRVLGGISPIDPMFIGNCSGIPAR
jgi:hypothetical protein